MCIRDSTTDGCFVLGAAVSVTLTAAGHPLLAVPAAMLAGACAGFITAFLQTCLLYTSWPTALWGMQGVRILTSGLRPSSE